MVVDYFAYWNGAQIRDLFEAVVAITSGPSYQGLLKSAVLAGFLVTLSTALFRWQALASKTFLFACVLFYSVLLIPKVDMNIQDERAGTVHVVQNVPLGIGFFAGMTSSIGHYLTAAFESGFSLPDSERFSRFGMVYPQRALSALQNAGAVTPEGRQLVLRFIADCVSAELIDYPEKVNELAQSSDLWKTVTQNGWLNPARSSLKDDGSVQSCDQAAVYLENYLNNQELSEIKKRLGAILVPDRLDPGQIIASSLPHVEALLLGMTRSLDTSLKHSVMLQALPHGMASIAKQAGAPLELAVNLSRAQGNLASEINYRTMSDIAQASLPKIRNCVEFVIIAAFPLIVVLLLAAGSAAGTVFRSFFVLLIWVQLWAPLFAVANYLLITVDSNPLNRIVAEYGGNTLLAADIIRQTGASSQAIAGYLMIAIPLLALAIAKASDHAAVAMVGSLLAPAQSASQSSSGQISAGNFSAGNYAHGNTSANNAYGNKQDLSSSFADPFSSRTQTAYGSVTRDGDNNVTGMIRSGIDLGVSQQSSLQMSNTQSTSSGTSSTLSQTDMTNLSMTRSGSDSIRGSNEFANSMTNVISEVFKSTDATSAQTASGRTDSTGTSDSVSRGLSTSEGFGIQSGGGIRLGAEKDVGNGNIKGAENAVAQAGAVGNNFASPTVQGTQTLTVPNQTGSSGTAGAETDSKKTRLAFAANVLRSLAGFEGSFKTSTLQSLVDTATGADTAATQAQRTQAYNLLQSAAKEVAANSTDAGTRSQAKAFSQSLDKAYQAANQQAMQFARNRSAASQQTSAQSGSDNTSVNNDVLIMRRLLSQGF